jgi:hypothetical protein
MSQGVLHVYVSERVYVCPTVSYPSKNILIGQVENI